MSSFLQVGKKCIHALLHICVVMFVLGKSGVNYYNAIVLNYGD